MEELELTRHNIDLVILDDNGEYTVEFSDDYFKLFFEDVEINLNSPYNLDGLKVSQGESEITFKSQEDYQYFLEAVKDFTNAPN